jgi:hypothetical protein
VVAPEQLSSRSQEDESTLDRSIPPLPGPRFRRLPRPGARLLRFRDRRGPDSLGRLAFERRLGWSFGSLRRGVERRQCPVERRQCPFERRILSRLGGFEPGRRVGAARVERVGQPRRGLPRVQFGIAGIERAIVGHAPIVGRIRAHRRLRNGNGAFGGGTVRLDRLGRSRQSQSDATRRRSDDSGPLSVREQYPVVRVSIERWHFERSPRPQRGIGCGRGDGCCWAGSGNDSQPVDSQSRHGDRTRLRDADDSAGFDRYYWTSRG